MNVEAKLAEMKSRVDEAKRDLTRAEANYEAALERLRELGYNSVADAEKELKKMERQISDEEAAIEEGLRKLEQDYPEL